MTRAWWATKAAAFELLYWASLAAAVRLTRLKTWARERCWHAESQATVLAAVAKARGGK